MTQEDFCKRCSHYAGCGFISRNLQTKCDTLQIFEEGYEQAIEKACEWIERNYHATPMGGYYYLPEDCIEQFRKAMKGGKE